MPRRVKGELWIIEFDSPDSSQCFTNAYRSKQEAVQAACDFIKYTAKDELEGIEWGEGEEAPKLLQEALDAIKEGRLDDAVSAWLEFQDEYDPSEQIAIGPSGNVGSGAIDFSHHAEGGATKKNPSDSCAVHDTNEECRSDPSSCRFGGCDGVESYKDGTCKTRPRYYADTKSFFCQEHRKKFLEDYRWDDRAGEWVERS